MASIQARTDRNGRIRYSAQVRRAGRKPIFRTFSSKRHAEQWCAELEREFFLQNNRLPAIDVQLTVAEAIDRYMSTELLNRPKTIRSTGLLLKYWRSRFSEVKLNELSTSMIDAVKRELLSSTSGNGKKRSPATINRYLAALSVVLNAAVRDWGVLSESPMSRIRKLKEPRGRVKYLDNAQRDRLLSACGQSKDPYINVVVLVALCTGMRLGEILGLRRENVDLEADRLIVQESKNGERRSIPLVDPAKSALIHFLDDSKARHGLLFPAVKSTQAKPKDIRKAWLAVARKAELNDFRFHDLRHSCASYLAMSGASLLEIAEVLGHKTLNMVKRYAHLSPNHTHEVVRRMSEAYLSNAESGSRQ